MSCAKPSSVRINWAAFAMKSFIKTIPPRARAIEVARQIRGASQLRGSREHLQEFSQKNGVKKMAVVKPLLFSFFCPHLSDGTPTLQSERIAQWMAKPVHKKRTGLGSHPLNREIAKIKGIYHPMSGYLYSCSCSRSQSSISFQTIRSGRGSHG